MDRPPGPDPGEAREGAQAALGGELRCVELCPICRGAEILRQSGPPELRGSMRSVQREALLTMRTLIDAYVERLEAEDANTGPRVENIPIR
jgi:hypothetical protein